MEDGHDNRTPCGGDIGPCPLGVVCDGPSRRCLVDRLRGVLGLGDRRSREGLIPAGRRRICDIEGPAMTMRRLAEMGLCPGSAVEVLRFGDPCILKVGGSRIGLGGTVQACIRTD